MAKTAVIHARMDDSLKTDAQQVFDALGINMTEAITMFFRQVVLKNGMPFALTADAASLYCVPDPGRKKNACAVEPGCRAEEESKISSYRLENVRRLLSAVPACVEEIRLFGSAITPYCRPDSDLDILVVGEQLTHDALKTLYKAPGCAVDLIDATPSDFALWQKEEGSIYAEAAKGLQIYRKEK